ncbi:MAG: YbaN family protein [Acidobacteriota bacterium]|nr:YbaN family protein [Blastocatellia bacterium]MDW8413691.1 YbaN family protein [Acidobacteriota bacterium]
MEIESAFGQLKRSVLIVLGSFFVMLGIAGIFLPLIPGMPFFLVAAWCYARSSRKFYTWLLQNNLFGHYVRDYQQQRGMRPLAKVKAISVLWVGILCATFFAESVLLQMTMIATAVAVTYIILSVRTVR